MIISKGLKYFLIYLTISVTLLSWSVYDSLSNTINYITFIVEFTEGIKLGVLINFIFLLFILTNKSLQLILFGSLRIIEIEHLVERIPIFIVNLLFNLTTNDNNLILNCFLLGLSISFKFLHIILTDRLDFMSMKIVNNSQNEVYTRVLILKKFLFSLHFWLNFLFFILDFSIAKFLVYDVFQGINTVTCLLFGFQFAIQGVESLCYFSKLLLSVYELFVYRAERDEVKDGMNMEEEEEEDDMEKYWENKPYYTKGIDIASALLKAISYLCFIYLLVFHSGLSLPISMLQGTYSSLRQAFNEITQLFAFIESSKRLESQLRNATKEELENGDNICSICREDMHSVEDYENNHTKKLSVRKYPKKLKCSHILHMGCLKDWLERSENCPLCRRKVFEQESDENNITSENNGSLAQSPQPPIQPINHPAEELQRRLNEFDELVRNSNQQQQAGSQAVNRLNIPGEHPTNSSTSSSSSQVLSSSTITASSGNYQTIRLPSTAIIPPGWTILPLHKENDNEFKVDFSTFHQGSLKIKQKQSNRELNLINPGLANNNNNNDIMKQENNNEHNNTAVTNTILN